MEYLERVADKHLKERLNAMAEAKAKAEEAARISKENMEKAFANLAEQGAVTNE